MKQFKFNLPLRIRASKSGKKFIAVNMNEYRNMHHHLHANLKTLYGYAIEEQLAECPVFDKPIMIEYTWFPGGDRRADMDNVTGVTKKYFQDCLVQSGKLKDDDKRSLLKNVEVVGHVDDDNPRIEAVVTELSDEYVAEHSVDAQLARHHQRLIEEFADDLLEDKEAMIKTEIFRSYFNIDGPMRKKQIKEVIEMNYGHKYIEHKRNGKYLYIGVS